MLAHITSSLTPCGFQAGRSHVQGASRSRTAVPIRPDDCLLMAEVGRRLRSADTRTLCRTADRDPVW